MRKQHGIVLLVFAAIVLLGFSAALMYALGRWRDPVTNTRNYNAEVLQQAKAALIGYVAKEVLDLGNNTPGLLPCPETLGSAGTSNEGAASAASGCKPSFASAKTVGRLPWRTLGVDKMVDASSEPLWYAVSPNWVYDGTSNPVVNSGTVGQLTVDGTSDVVAVIIAPGAPLLATSNANQTAAGCAASIAQSRNDRAHTGVATNLNYLNYLECQDPSLLVFRSSVTDNATNKVSNDQMVFITSKDILNAIQGPLSDRLQRTVAPLLSEFGDKWVAPGSKFLPYAVAFQPPELNLAADSHCGPSAASQATEGLLPIAPNSGACSSAWTGDFSGDGITSMGCSGTPVTCSFRYYRFTVLGQILLGLTGANNLSATLQATAPHAAASFRVSSIQNVGDITVTAGSASLSNFVKPAPRTTGDVTMSVQADVSSPNICLNSLLGGLLCGALPGLFVTTQTVSVQFAQLSTPVLSGTKLSTAVKNGGSSFDLLSPAPGDPHYWFMHNEWYRYTYYALAPSATAGGPGGGDLTVSGFPTANGSATNKKFVLALMGPAVSGQLRSSTAAMNQYVEGQNAVTTGSPRTFAYQVYAATGNDRIATCPFTDGASPCD